MSFCSICLDKKHTTFAVIPCKHEFCDNCIWNWLEKHSTCPLCRCTADKAIMMECRDSFYGSDSNLFKLAWICGAS